MLKEKFGIEEEPPKKRNSFQDDFNLFADDFSTGGMGFAGFTTSSTSRMDSKWRGRDIQTRPDFATRGYISSTEVNHPDERTIGEGIYRLREQIPRIREMFMEASPDFAHYLIRNERDFIAYDHMGQRPREGELDFFGSFRGMKVYISRNVRHAVVSARHGF